MSMSLVIASVVMGLDGAFYCALGLCMLFPSSLLSRRSYDIARLYPSLFKTFLVTDPVLRSFDEIEAKAGAKSDSSNNNNNNNNYHSEEPANTSVAVEAFQTLVLNSSVRPLGELAQELGFRLLAYLLIIVGVCRLITGFHWGCGYIYLALATCLGEIFMVCNELLREESVLLHRAMAIFLSNMVLSLVYLSAGLPYCATS